MAQVFSTTNAVVPAPIMSGGYYPGIDIRQVDGRGMVQPWGGGPLSRQFQTPVPIGQEPTAETNIQNLIGLMVQALPAGNIINYNFEGLVGPASTVPGPPGPTTFIFARDVDGHVLNAPTRVLSDGAVPGTVANVAATALIQAVMLEWDANSELDIDHYIVYRHTSDASGSSSAILTTYATLCVDGNRTGGTAYYYWVKAVDYEGNVSAAYSTSVNATPTNVQTGDIVTLEASKVLISGATYLSNWRHSSDVTKIDGGDIHASSITLTSAASDFALASIGGDADDIGDGTTNKMYTGTEQTKLGGVATGADVTSANTCDTPDVDHFSGKTQDDLGDGTSYIQTPIAWLKSGQTTIDGGQIYTDSIVTNSLAANLITYAELRQVGGSEAVDTGCIRSNAATRPASAYTAGAIECADNAETTIQTVSGFVSKGGAISVWANAVPGPHAVQWRIYRDATLLYEYPSATTYITNAYLAPQVTTAPGAGTYAFTLRIFVRAAEVHQNWSARSLIVHELTR